MERLGDDDRRTVVPRWRALTETPLYELGGKPAGKPLPKSNLVLDRALEKWKAVPDALSAAEVADAVSLVGPDERSAPALAFLEAASADLLPFAFPRKQNELSKKLASEQDVHSQIASKKARLKDQPRNSIGHVEIARLYAIAGQIKAATKHMELALRLSPETRYILRSASRLFVHADDPARALYFLRRSTAAKHDPWVMAAEVAISDLSGKAPKVSGKELVSLMAAPKLSIRYSELASALGVLEDENGAHRRAKKLIKKSLDQPTENSLAQAVWMSSKAKRNYVPLNEHYQDTAYEAGVIQAVHVKDYERADRFAWNWLSDEAFSSAPAIHGSYINSVFTRSYVRALAFAERGLASNPDDEILKNNRTFALIMSGRIDDARKWLPKLTAAQTPTRQFVFDLAINGLFSYRTGAFEEGRRHYQQAVELALSHFPALFPSAIAHWLENEVVTGQSSLEEFMRIAPLVDKRISALKLDPSSWLAVKSFLGPETAPKFETFRTKSGTILQYHFPE